MSAETRTCKTCSNNKPLESGFRPHIVKGKTYYDYECRVCQLARANKWYADNRERATALDRQQYWEDPDSARAEALEGYHRNKAKRLAHAAARRAGPAGDRVRAMDAEAAKRWREAHPFEAQAWPNKRRALKRSVQAEPITKKQIEGLFLKQKGCCAICRKKLTARHIDHIIPLKLGGEHGIKNFQLLCPRCNLSKKHSHPIDYMQKLGFLL
jgi:5-methylcytosine-specific restriction endonuclease McrA